MVAMQRTGLESTGIALRAKQALEVFGATNSGLAALGSFVFPGLGWGGETYGGNFAAGWLSVEPRDFPYRHINAYNSSVVMACINAITAGLKQAPIRVYRMSADGTKVYLPQHRLAKLLRRPNPFYSWSKLLGALSISFNLKGNAYIFKEKADNGLGATRALYYIPHFMIVPKRPLDGSQYLSHYEYSVDGKMYRLRPDQVIHLKYDIDPYNTLMGRDPLHPVLSTIFADEEADKFTSALLRNTAIPGVTIIPETGVNVKPADAEALKENFRRKFGGDNRGEPLVLGFAGKVEQMGFNPEQLQMKEARRLPEERVAAQYRVAPVFAGLGAGLDRSTYSNYEQAERHSYETGIVPIWDEWGDDFTTAFSPEFFTSDESYGVEFDYSKVKALNESQDSVVTRAVKLYQVDGIDRAELREITGYVVDEGRDRGVYYSSTRPRPVAIGAPPPNGDTPRKSLKERIVAATLALKSAPPDNLDRAYDLQLEAEVKEVAGVMERELDALYAEMAEKAGREGKSLDRDNPQAETERILGDVLKAVGVSAALAAIWARMAEDTEDAGRIAVALRVAVDYGDVWNDGAKAASASAMRSAVLSYEEALRDQTRKAILEAIKGAEQGEAVDSIARRIKTMVAGREMYPGLYQEGYDKAISAGASPEQAQRAGESKARRYRAGLIAETEVRTHQNVVTLEAMAATGQVDKVKVVDGSACGWRYHDDADRAHGTTRLLNEARRYPTVHPRCKRRFYPAT
jgi:HK97 family phage portal protein